MSDAAGITLPRVLVNLIGLQLPDIEKMRLPTSQFVRVWTDDEAPVLLVWETSAHRDALIQALALWNKGIPALISEDPDEEASLFRFLLQPHE